MKKILLLTALAATTLAGCAPAIIGNAPAPLEQTTIDEKGLLAAFSAFDVALTAVDGLVATKVIVPGTPTALKIKGYLVIAQNGLNAAAAAQKAGSTTDYVKALNSAREALTLASAALKGI